MVKNIQTKCVYPNKPKLSVQEKRIIKGQTHNIGKRIINLSEESIRDLCGENETNIDFFLKARKDKLNEIQEKENKKNKTKINKILKIKDPDNHVSKYLEFKPHDTKFRAFSKVFIGKNTIIYHSKSSISLDIFRDCKKPLDDSSDKNVSTDIFNHKNNTYTIYKTLVDIQINQMIYI